MLWITAPDDFDNRILKDVEYVQEVVYERKDFKPFAGVTEWICNPNAHFVIDAAVLKMLPKLMVLATPSTGTNHIDLQACANLGIPVISLLDDRPGLETIQASAEFTFHLLVIGFKMKPRNELWGKRVGLVGHGRIGKKVHKFCEAFGMTVSWRDENGGTPMAELFKCDAVVICCTLNDKTRGMITKELITSMPKYGVFVNTARGEIVSGLEDALRERPDLRVAVDVLPGETNGTADPAPLRRLGAVVTPHMAGESVESRTKAMQIVLKLLKEKLLCLQ